MMKNKLILSLAVSVLSVSTGCSRPAADYSQWYDNPQGGQELPDDSGGTDVEGTGETIHVMSSNVRYASASSDVGTSVSWDNRKIAFPAMFEDQKPLVIGVQEAELEQIEYLQENCAGYDYIGVGREDGKQKGEFMAIFYRTEDVAVARWGTFWLSDTPDEPSKAVSWGAGSYRSATWAVFRIKSTGTEFFYINTHLDLNENAREKSMVLIESKMAELNRDGLPMLLTADFNTQSTSGIFDGIKEFMLDARAASPVTDNLGTYNNWGKSSQVVDHIFCSGFIPREYSTVRQRYEEVPYISDHYPVSAFLEFEK